MMKNILESARPVKKQQSAPEDDVAQLDENTKMIIDEPECNIESKTDCLWQCFRRCVRALDALVIDFSSRFMKLFSCVNTWIVSTFIVGKCLLNLENSHMKTKDYEISFKTFIIIILSSTFHLRLIMIWMSN